MKAIFYKNFTSEKQDLDLLLLAIYAKIDCDIFSNY